MAVKKKEVESKEFPMSLKDFLATISIKEVESRRAFQSLLVREGQAVGRKKRAEWQQLYTWFKEKPLKIKWTDFLAIKNKRR